MTKTKKWLAVLLAFAVVMAMCLAGCKTQETTKDSAKEVVTYEKTENPESHRNGIGPLEYG